MDGWMDGISYTECLCPSKIYMLNPSSQGDGVRTLGLWEVGALMNGISVIIREILLRSLAFLPHEGTQDISCLQSGRGPPQNLAMLAPQPQTSSLWNYEKQISDVYKPPSTAWSEQSKRTRTDGKQCTLGWECGLSCRAPA
jgi:hypothetical protein